MTAPYLELICLDCGTLYTPEQGDCPNCGSANVSYDSEEAERYADAWNWMGESERWGDTSP